MKQFLKRIGLTENFTIEMAVDRSDFVKVLSANIDPPGVGFFEVFSKSKNAYKGTVKYDSFDLKRRKKFVDHGSNLITMKGRFRQKNDKLEIDLELTAFHVMMIPFVVFGLIVYGAFIVNIVTGWSPGEGDSTVPIWTVPFMFVHAGLMFGLPYFFLRRSLQSAKYNVERDLFFMMKEKVSRQQSVV